MTNTKLKKPKMTLGHEAINYQANNSQANLISSARPNKRVSDLTITKQPTNTTLNSTQQVSSTTKQRRNKADRKKKIDLLSESTSIVWIEWAAIWNETQFIKHQSQTVVQSQTFI